MAVPTSLATSQRAENFPRASDLTRKSGREDDEIDGPEEPPRKRVETRNQEVIDLTKTLPPVTPASLPCVSCGDDYDPSSLAHMSCEHYYCQECLQKVVLNALNDEACYPPRCCRQPFQVSRLPEQYLPLLFALRVLNVSALQGHSLRILKMYEMGMLTPKTWIPDGRHEAFPNARNYQWFPREESRIWHNQPHLLLKSDLLGLPLSCQHQ
jgi:hypothetical protein